MRTKFSKLTGASLLWVALVVFIAGSAVLYSIRSGIFFSDPNVILMQQIYNEYNLDANLDLSKAKVDASQKLLQLKEENNRTTFQMIAGFGGLLALLTTIWRIGQTERQIKQTFEDSVLRHDNELKRLDQTDSQLNFTREQINIQRLVFENQISADRDRRSAERLTSSIEQIGSGNIGVRIGGFFSLGRISSSSEGDYRLINELITSWIRASFPKDSDSQYILNSEGKIVGAPEDLVAALYVISHRAKTLDDGTPITGGLDMRGVRLSNVRLSSGTLRGIDFSGSTIENCHFENLTFEDCEFSGAVLRKNHYFSSKFLGNNYSSANIEGLDFYVCELRGEEFKDCNLSGFVCEHSELINCNFEYVTLKACDLSYTKIENCDFSGDDISRTDISDVKGLSAFQLRTSKLNEFTTLSPEIHDEIVDYVKLRGEIKVWGKYMAQFDKP